MVETNFSFKDKSLFEICPQKDERNQEWWDEREQKGKVEKENNTTKRMILFLDNFQWATQPKGFESLSEFGFMGKSLKNRGFDHLLSLGLSFFLPLCLCFFSSTSHFLQAPRYLLTILINIIHSALKKGLKARKREAQYLY